MRDQIRLTPAYARELAADYLENVAGEVVFPNELSDFRLSEQRSSDELEELRKLVKEMFDDKADVNEGDHPHQSTTPDYLKEIFFFVPVQIALQLKKADEYLSALDWFRTVYAYDLSPDEERKIYYGLVLEEQVGNDYHEPDWLQPSFNPHQIVIATSQRTGAYTRFTLLSLVRCFLDFADDEFTQETNESIPNARSLYLTALEMLELEEMHPETGEEDASPFPENPVLDSLRRHAELNLLKLRSGRNIAGVELRSDALLEIEAGVAGAGEAIPQQVAPPPTRYRYSALIDRAKQLVDVAQQLEAAFLSAIEKRDTEAYNLLQARQDVELTRATLQLQDLHVSQAEGNVMLSKLQRESALLRHQTYQRWINDGLNEHEREMINSYLEAASAKKSAANLNFASQAFSSLLPFSGIGDGPGPSDLVKTGTGLATASSLITGFLGTRQKRRAIDASTSAQVASVHASFERRKDEWELQNGLAGQDMEIGTRQVMLAFTQNQIALQEREIAGMQTEHAEAAVEFLSTRFTNAELYEWMSGVLNQVYAYFLQQASAIGRLAQRQLAFERQEPPPAHIQTNYWRPPTDTQISSESSADGKARDRRGLTGSARLLQDIHRLDQYAFETRRQKLELSQTFSLAQLVPFEFQQFRKTGILPFATPMKLFDQAFPGHYLRLIKRIRVSVIALIPPTEGIRAPLTSSGISRTIIERARQCANPLPNDLGNAAFLNGQGKFLQTLIRRSPEQIAFTSPVDATGVLELEPEKGLLLSFEGTGVDTSWELQMPKPANRLDFQTVADVLFTVEYTSLHNDTYARQVVESLDRSFSADRPFSLRQQFPDQWFDLHNPAQSQTPMSVQLEIRQEDFPPNLEELKIGNVLLYFIRGDDDSFEVDADLRFTSKGSEVSVGGSARSVDGIISTRRPVNALAWKSIIGTQPVGSWELKLPNNDEVRNLFTNELTEDILFVINYEGQTPGWPM